MLFTIGATYIFYKNEKSKDLVRFRGETDSCKNRVESKLKAYSSLLKSARGFVEASAQLNKKSFSGFVNSLEIEKNHPEINQLGFIKRINHSERENLIKIMQAEHQTEFKIFPAAEAEEYYPVVYAEPANSSLAPLIGFNMSVNPAFQSAMQQAKESGETVATGKIQFDREDEPTRISFVAFTPVYKGGGIPASVEERNNLLDGFIYDSVDAENFLMSARESAGVSDIALTVYESQLQPENLIAETVKNFQPDKRSLINTNQINLAGKNWIIGYQTLPSFEDQSGVGWTPAVFVIGVIFSLMLFGTTYLESNARAKAEKISCELSESEKEKGFLLELEQKARRAAEESSQAKDEFISIVSHELRTPLNSIAGWSKILHNENLPKEIKLKALRTIDKNVRIQTGIVENLLDLSQILSGTQILRKTETVVSDVFEEVFAESEIVAKNKKVSLTKKNELDSQKILADKERLKQIFRNLISNAIKFTPAGGKVSVSLTTRNNEIEIKISDTGQGIDSKTLPRIFEDFKQGDSSITRIHGGLGLGLAIVRRIVELHNGQITVASEGEGKGTVFTVRLPVTNL